MNTPQRPARKAIVIAAMSAPCTSRIVVSAWPSPGRPMSRGVASVLAIARVMKTNGSATSSTPSRGRRACSRRPMRVAVASRALTLGSWRPR